LYDSATTLILKDKNIREAFLPKRILGRLDQTNTAVQEGLRITFKLLDEMNRTCRSNNIAFVVAVIPTKETVFADYLEHNSPLPLNDVMDKLIANERIARSKLFAFLNESGIRYVDTLPALKQSVEHELYTRTSLDMHPNKNGYKVIAETVAKNVGRAPVTAENASGRVQALHH
jgi:lysophospholipase L1-like esterase